jgi:hypothetical protein
MSEPSLLMTHGGLLVGALLVTALLGLILQVRNQHRLIRHQLQHMEDLQGAVAAYGQSLIASRTLLERMENRLAEFSDRNLEIQSQFAFNRSFEEASRLVKDGTTVESLVNDCGLSDAEAALMIRLHQRDRERPRQQWRQPAGVNSPTAAESPEPAISSDTMTSEEIRLKESLLAAHSR